MDIAASHTAERDALLLAVRQLRRRVYLVNLWIGRAFSVGLVAMLAAGAYYMVSRHEYGWVRNPLAWVLIVLLSP